jgi:hypothetical protein
VSMLLETPKKGQLPKNRINRILLTRMALIIRRIKSLI